MAKPVLRVDLSTNSSEFSLLAVEPGMPLLDRFNGAGSLLKNWVGRFAAEPEWDEPCFNFYVLDESGARLGEVDCWIVSESDLRGELQEEFRLLQQRLREAEPRSSSAREIHQYVSRSLLATVEEVDWAKLRYQLFKYRDVQGTWRLVWCYGYRTAVPHASAPPVICPNTDCHLLILLDSAERRCPRCGALTRRRSEPKHYGRLLAALAVVFLACAAAVAGYGWYRMGVKVTGTVARAADQRAIAGASVGIVGESARAVCGARGAFALEGLPWRELEVQVAAPGYRTETVRVHPGFGRPPGVQILLRGDSRLEGRVVCAIAKGDLGIAKASVRMAGSEERTTQTDENGYFTFRGIDPSPVKLQVAAPGFRGSEGAATAPGDPKIPLRIVLTSDRQIAGKVVYAADQA